MPSTEITSLQVDFSLEANLSHPPVRLFVTSEGGVSPGVTHRDRDDEGNRDHRREVIGEPHFVADRFEPQCDRLGRPAEYRSRDRKGQTYASGSNSGWEQLGLYHRIYRC